ncbi:MAG: RNA polymerase factor sigma-54 [Deltaproteobacteria bacterium]|nr:RNA polymerase factor sigma-54 [Deltaproteobacteria bacterium]MBW2085514.1 RNA polymerase factor sigma-54 [Deltaproteobacteria bacterium]
MGLQLRQTLKLTQQLVMTPQLQQAIKMLQLSRLELLQTIRQELEENAVLETDQDEDIITDEGDGPDGEQPKTVSENDFTEVRVEEKAREDIDWASYLDEYSSSSAPSMREVPEESNYETFISAKTSLVDHLTWQWRMGDLTPREDLIAAQIIGNLGEDGYLQISLEEITVMENMPLEEVQQVLAKVQELDPVGVAARDLRECLLIQLKYLGQTGSLAERIVSEHLSELEKKNYQKIARKLKTSKEKVFEAVEIILNLEPKPGRSFITEEPQYITPDVYIYKIGGEYVIVLNEDGLPRLKVNRYYRDILTNRKAVSDQTKEYIQGKLRSAVWLIRSIHQRQRTIYRVTESIIKFQREFLDKGIPYLKPLVLRDVAEDVEMHESTISRVTSNKYVHTPQGIFELKFFFNSSISKFDGESLASESVKERIRKIIAAEDPHKPLSDQRIVEILRASNINIARRTVAKYRDMLGILSSSKRKKHF